MPRTYNFDQLSPTSSSTHASYLLLTSLSNYASSPCRLPTYSPRSSSTMPRTYNFDQLSPTSSSTHASYLLLTSLSNYASSPCRLPTYSPRSSSTHASYLQLWSTSPTSSPPMPPTSYSQVCPTTPPHPVGCQPTALQVRPPMPRTYNSVQLCPTSSSTHAVHASSLLASLFNYAYSLYGLPTYIISKHFSFFIWYISTFSLLTWHPLNHLFPPRCHKPAMLRSKELLPTPLGPHSINDSPERRFRWHKM